MSLTITRKVSVSGGTVLRAANNLGDVASVATSRTNLGLGTGDSPQFTALKGTTTNDNAATGYIGEYVSSTVASGSAITLTNATAANVTSLSLTAGDWDVSGVITFNGAVTGSYSTAGISTTSAAHQAYPNSVDSPYLPTAAANASTVVPAIRISVASTTTVYLVALEAFSAGTAKAYGFISARRVR